MERNIEYIQLFMEYESDDMPMVYFYEVDVNDDRFALRAIEIFVDRTVKFYKIIIIIMCGWIIGF